MRDTVGGRYVLGGRLGEGGMGQVFRAHHVGLGKAFALKLIAPALALDVDARARFELEAKLASEISHPNIVSVVDFGEDEKLGAYMVMELVDGEALVGGAPMSIRRACDVLAQIADALDHIHERGIVHGDVKAENIMLTVEAAGRRHVARLLDFGLARRPDAAAEDRFTGSPHYLAPERAAGGPPSVAADIYALGVLGYLLVTGTLPFGGNVVEILMAHINQQPERLAVRRTEAVPEALEALVARALAKDPAKRHASAGVFRRELDFVMERRRRPSSTISPGPTREAVLVAAWERSRIPQALLSLDGRIVQANQAFLRFFGPDTGTLRALPGLHHALHATHESGLPCERRVRVGRGPERPSLELCVWLAPLPLPGSEIHVMIRVEEAPQMR